MKFVVFVCTFAIIAVISCYAEEFKCIDEVPYIENHCNSCFCANGALGCTEMYCTTQEKQEKCKVGETWNEGCNKCWCDDKMGTICTNNKC